jgi:hypothetical protein
MLQPLADWSSKFALLARADESVAPGDSVRAMPAAGGVERYPVSERPAAVDECRSANWRVGQAGDRRGDRATARESEETHRLALCLEGHSAKGRPSASRVEINLIARVVAKHELHGFAGYTRNDGDRDNLRP